MEEKKQCLKCDKMAYLKEGQYGPYYSHKVSEGVYHNMKPKEYEGYQSPFNRTVSSSFESSTKATGGQPDWNAISRGKVRCQVAVAFIGRLEKGDVAVPSENLTRILESWKSG